MRHVKISGCGSALPCKTVKFGDDTRYRLSGDETQLGLAVEASNKALEDAGMDISDIDCIVYASAVMFQPIPCSAAILHEQIAKGTDIPALDINTTCTSFISALDIMSYLIDAGRYNNVLIVSGDSASLALNPNQKESYELFSDASSAYIISRSDDNGQWSGDGYGILASKQITFSEGAHDTEIRGGLGLIPPWEYSEETKADFQFDMKGIKVLSLAAKKLPKILEDFEKQSMWNLGLTYDTVDLIIPHQASRALPVIMKKLRIPENKYINIVQDYGNMVSASIPFTLDKCLKEGRLKTGNTVALIGTAAGLTINIMLMRLAYKN